MAQGATYVLHNTSSADIEGYGSLLHTKESGTFVAHVGLNETVIRQ